MLRIKPTLAFSPCASRCRPAPRCRTRRTCWPPRASRWCRRIRHSGKPLWPSLPPHKFVHQVRNNAVIFTYADPTICDCLYVGNQAAYDRYRRDVFAKNIANEQQMTAQINEMNWGPWGPGWYY